MPDLKGTTALVTGGANGIGAATCAALAGYGAAVAVTDANLEAAEKLARELGERGLRAEPFRHDVVSWDSAHAVAGAVEERLGAIDILVNNAGVSRFVDFVDIDEAEWDRVIDINLKGVFITTRAVLPKMIERKRGRIVSIASVCGKIGAPKFSHYSASKFGVIGLSQAIAAEVAPLGITVNTVCPGIVETPLKDDLVKQMTGGAEFADAGTAKRWFESQIPLGVPQPPADIAEMVAFLVSEHGRNMTGGSYHVDGGITPR